MAILLLIGFVVRERLARTLLVPLRIFRSRTTSGANLVQALTMGAVFGLFFLGALLFFAALMTLAMSAATASDSGLVNTTQQVGGAVGLAVLATFSTARTESLLERGESTASALTSGYHLAWGIGLGLAIAGILLAVVLLRPETAPHEEEAGLGAAQPAYSEG